MSGAVRHSPVYLAGVHRDSCVCVMFKYNSSFRFRMDGGHELHAVRLYRVVSGYELGRNRLWSNMTEKDQGV